MSDFFLNLYPVTHIGCTIEPAIRSRQWMKENPHVFKCGPVTNYNSFGWDLITTEEVIAEWNGGNHKDDMYAVSPNEIAHSNFGFGVLTFRPGYTFHTPDGWSLVFTSIPNHNHDFFEPISALVETDILKYPVFPSVRLFKSGRYVFPKGTPICRMFPVQSDAVVTCTPQVLPEPDEFTKYRTWQATKREKFLVDKQPGGWQKFYHNMAHKPVVRMNKPEILIESKILIQDNFLTEDECDALLEICKTATKLEGNGDWKERLIRPVYPDAIRQKLFEYRKEVCEHFFEEKLKIDNVHCVIWRQGNFMPPHSDYGAREEYPDRHIASIIYLNHDYEGGDLYMPALNINRKPKKGQLIAFHGGRIMHGVKPVKSGTRYTNICWFNILGQE